MGIDVAKETHVAQATNFRGVVLSKRHLTFSNTIEGFEKLERWIEGIGQKHRLKDLIIGMEPTSHNELGELFHTVMRKLNLK
ncbi:transposase [Paenibacillus sp. 2TAB23]|uniref:IS110 family transposase n=1 Tax=Paenibacillus sp. 2TAB23 TaxID=3233004 RepID=UPI003F96C2B5